MNQILKLIATSTLALAATFITISAANASTAPLTVACYGPNGDNFTVYFDQENMTVTYASTIGGVSDTFQSIPSSFGAPFSSMTLNGGDLHAHIVSGDPIQPIIDSDVQLTLTPDADPGKMTLVSAIIYHGKQLDVSSLYGQSCYVQ